MPSSSFTERISSAFAKIPEKFYSYFPTLRKQYQKVHELNAVFAKIEQVAFPSFPSFTKSLDKPDLLQNRAKIIQEIQGTSIEGKTIHEWLRIGEEKLNKSQSKDLYTHERAEWDRFEQQLLGLQYRSGAIATGSGSENTPSALFLKIEPVIRKYLSASSLFPGRYDPKTHKELPQLNSKEKEQLEHACATYPVLIEKFLARAKNSKDPWTASFVKWALRSNCNIGVFVKTPQEKELLASVHLDKRSGAVDGKKGICFQDVVIDGASRKVVCLKIDGKMEPIQGALKKRNVTLKNLIDPKADGLTLSIEKIIRIFKEKTNGYGKVEYLKNGVCDWNAIECGSYNQTTKRYDTINPDKFFEELLNKVPLVAYTEQEISTRYKNWNNLAPNQWGLALRASRSKADLNVLQAHGYKDLIYRKEDVYYVFPIGIQPKKFPKTSIEKLLFFSSTSVAGNHYPDESFYLSLRDQIGIIFPLSDVETDRMQKELVETYLQAKKGNLLFQFAGDNCAFHIQKLFDKVIAAPFYEKIQSVLNGYLSSKNIISKLLIQNNSVRAFQGLNHGLLKEILSYMVDDLWEKRDFSNLSELTRHSIDLLTKIYNHPFDPIAIDKIDFSKDTAKEEIKNLLFQTVQLARFYRMDLFRSKTDQPFLSTVNKIISIAPWRWLKRGIINTVLLIMGSWRWVIIAREEKQERILPHISLKNLASNPLIREGYLNHPAALWEWVSLRNQRLVATQQCLNNLRSAL